MEMVKRSMGSRSGETGGGNKKGRHHAGCARPLSGHPGRCPACNTRANHCRRRLAIATNHHGHALFTLAQYPVTLIEVAQCAPSIAERGAACSIHSISFWTCCCPCWRLRPPVPRANNPSSNCARCGRSEEHTSELQSPCNLVCRLLLEK